MNSTTTIHHWLQEMFGFFNAKIHQVDLSKFQVVSEFDGSFIYCAENNTLQAA